MYDGPYGLAKCFDVKACSAFKMFRISECFEMFRLFGFRNVSNFRMFRNDVLECFEFRNVSKWRFKMFRLFGFQNVSNFGMFQNDVSKCFACSAFEMFRLFEMFWRESLFGTLQQYKCKDVLSRLDLGRLETYTECYLASFLCINELNINFVLFDLKQNGPKLAVSPKNCLFWSVFIKMFSNQIIRIKLFFLEIIKIRLWQRNDFKLFSQ